ncbi:MAG: hypothetical protein M3Y62_09225 [Candidatus Dormibacteraeota bacterium]|nr:hypothetical protein [Candidatus Dormibacteraeota bacterium]
MSLLSWALRPIRHDRWLVAALRDQRLRTVAQSQPDPDNPYRQLRELQPPAWRCLLSAQTTCVTRCGVSAGTVAGPREWELDSPAILYAPVGLPGQRAEGLLILANLRPHTYGTCEIRYVSLLAQGLLRWVASAAGSQSALHELLSGGRQVEQPPSSPTGLRSLPALTYQTGCSPWSFPTAHSVSADLSAAGGSAPIRLPERYNQGAAGKTEPCS